MAAILVIDDEWEILEFVTDELRKSGHQVLGLNESQTALDILRLPCNRYDLVLCDVMMPHQNGLDFAKEVMRIPRFDDEVALMSSYTNEIDEEMRAMGMRQSLRKPFTQQSLQEID